MSVTQWADTYGIHHWRNLRSSFRKLAWVVFELETTENRSDTLTNEAIRKCLHLPLTANFVLPLRFHYLFSITFYFSRFPSSVAPFISSKFPVANHMSVAEWADTYGIHHWRILWSSGRSLAGVGFENTISEPC